MASVQLYNIKNQRLRFPLEGSIRPYLGNITFRAFETIPPDTNVIKGITKAFEKRSSDIDLRNADPDADLEADAQMDETDQKEFDKGINSRTAVVDTFESCSMYLPPNIVVTDNIDYNTNVPLGVFGSIVENTMQQGGTFTQGMGAAIMDAGKSVVDAVLGSGTDGQGADLARTQLSRLAGMLPEGLEGAVRSGLQTTPNPNIRAIFKSVNLRDFVFQFKMVPKSSEEAEQIKRIIYFFRKNMYPESIPIGDISAGYKFPMKFDIQMRYAKKNASFNFQTSVATLLKKCYLRNVQTNYNPATMAMYDDGNFQEIDLSLVFVEEQTLDRQDIERGY